MWELSREQAHFPAEQSASQSYPWLPSPDAYPCRACHPRGPSSQGSRKAVCLSAGTVLPRAARMRSSEEFRSTVSGGVRVGRKTLVVHARRTGGEHPVRVGFVVSKAVGKAVTRNRVKRQLRHLVRDQLDQVPAGATFVVRALPAAATDDFRSDLQSAWSKALSRIDNQS